jgi:hypothetical protein
MYAFSKSSGKMFNCRSKDVCRVEEGSTNSYLLRDRIIEEFLKGIEPYYNRCAENLRLGIYDEHTVAVIAGYISYVTNCSPTSMRLATVPLRRAIETVAGFVDDTVADKLEQRELEIEVDKKYSQAVGIGMIQKTAMVFGNSLWDVLHNDNKHSAFFTSDFPSAIENPNEIGFLNRIIPLAPDLALKIYPDRVSEMRKNNLSFSNFRARKINPTDARVRAINDSIVKSAEDLVFFRDHEPWVLTFLAKRRWYRIESRADEVASGDGSMLVSTIRVTRGRS